MSDCHDRIRVAKGVNICFYIHRTNWGGNFIPKKRAEAMASALRGESKGIKVLETSDGSYC